MKPAPSLRRHTRIKRYGKPVREYGVEWLDAWLRGYYSRQQAG